MRGLTMFYLETCPYCKRARSYMDELKEENPEYARVPIQMIEERQEKPLADSYDYYYVPCYYIDGDKIAEGAIDKDGVREVFEKALKA